MPQQASTSLQNSFIGGLKTEFTGLNFPENSCTSADNTVFTIVGDVIRREGFDYEQNFTLHTIARAGLAISTYKWNNVGGDGLTQVIVQQVGGNLYFNRSSTATLVNPLSSQGLSTIIALSTFSPSGSPPPDSVECQYADGNGYLFVFHPNLEPFYCTYNAGTIVANQINVQIRDFIGIPEPGVLDSTRPLTLSVEHQYNLINQGWNSSWGATSTSSNTVSIASKTFTINSATLPIAIGSTVIATQTFPLGSLGQSTMTGTVTSYSGTTLVININSINTIDGPGPFTSWSIKPSPDNISAFFNSQRVYPSNSDVWWNFKNAAGAFDVATIPNVTIDSGPAPKGFFIMNAFNQDRSALSGILGLTVVSTAIRPKTGCWYQGRVWYTGVDASFPGTGDAPFSTWSENLYFSQVITRTDQFGKCFETNDPTSETLFDLLPTDGGVIQIQGCGSIYKVFPLKFGLVVFAANGIWFIGGTSGIGFTATDFSVTKISNIQSVSGISVVNVQGFPMFWNEEGIYHVTPAQQGGSAHSPDIALEVNNLCLGTILTFYAGIPLQSKKFARGDFNPLDYIVQWVYRDTVESDITSRYQFNRVINFNLATKAFYTYTLSTSTTSPYVHAVNYVAGPGGSTSPTPTFKYFTSVPFSSTYQFTYSEEKNINFVDWGATSNPLNYISSFTSGYALKGKGITKFQVPYLYMFSRNPSFNEYIIQSIWDYAGTGNSGRWSVRQVITNNNPNFTSLYKKHRLRGRGLAVQIKVTSVQGVPFDLMGWSIFDEVNQGI